MTNDESLGGLSLVIVLAMVICLLMGELKLLCEIRVIFNLKSPYVSYGKTKPMETF